MNSRPISNSVVCTDVTWPSCSFARSSRLCSSSIAPAMAPISEEADSTAASWRTGGAVLSPVAGGVLLFFPGVRGRAEHRIDWAGVHMVQYYDFPCSIHQPVSNGFPPVHLRRKAGNVDVTRIWVSPSRLRTSMRRASGTPPHSRHTLCGRIGVKRVTVSELKGWNRDPFGIDEFRFFSDDGTAQFCLCVTGTPSPTTNPRHTTISLKPNGWNRNQLSPHPHPHPNDRHPWHRDRHPWHGNQQLISAVAWPARAGGTAAACTDVAFTAAHVVRSLREANRNSDVKVQLLGTRPIRLVTRCRCSPERPGLPMPSFSPQWRQAVWRCC